MRPLMLTFALWTLATTASFAAEADQPADETVPGISFARSGLDVVVPAERELDRLLAENAERPVTDLTLGDVGAVIDLVSVANQQRDHVRRSMLLSWIAPGLGHFVNGERGAAAAFAAAEAFVGLATIVGAYWVLPPQVQYRNLNYLQTSFDAIETRWKTVAPAELVPAVSVAITGSLLSATIRFFAVRSSRSTALDALETEIVSFDPRPLAAIDR